MTPQEQQMIDGLITRIRNTQITDRDPVAADHLQQGLGNNPDALYILAQTVLVQQHSLEQAHAQMEQLEQQAQQREAAQQPAANTIQGQPVQQQGSNGSSWLSRFFGSDTGSSQPYAQPQQGQPYNAPAAPYQPVNAGAPPYGYPQQPYPPQGYAPPGYAQQGYASPFGQPMGMGGGGSFLRTAVQTAAGVAAGEMLFQGVESMFGGGEHRSNFGGGETINNYYEDGRSSGGEQHHEVGSDSSFYNPSNDASRGGSSFADTASQGNLTESQEDTLDDTSYAADDSNNVADDNSNDFDNSSSDDSSSYDDSNS